MKNNEAKSTKKLRFNAIDVLIVFLVIACIVAAVLRFTVLDNIFENNAEKEYIISFKIDSLTYAQIEAIRLATEESEIGGNWIYLSDGKTKLGEIIKLGEQNKETLTFVNDKGETITAEYAEGENEEDVTWTVTGTIACLGVYNDTNGFLLNGELYLASNSELEVFTKYCDFTLTVLEIEEAPNRQN